MNACKKQDGQRVSIPAVGAARTGLGLVAINYQTRISKMNNIRCKTLISSVLDGGQHPAEPYPVRTRIRAGLGLYIGRACRIGLSIAMFWAVSGRAQIIQQWTHLSVWDESSAAVGMDDNYMFVADNEDETLRLYQRYPGTPCAAPVYALDMRPYLVPVTTNPETDLESAVKVTDANGTWIYWLGSHSNSKTGKYRPDRFRLCATQVSGDGTGSPPYALSYVGRYDHLRDDLVAWDQNNQHGLGANYFGLAASAAIGVAPTRIDGFNIEGLVMAPDGTTAYVAFRAPLVNGSGPTTAASRRTHALLVPLLNMPALVAGRPTAGVGLARFGAPITLDLGGRGVRSIDSSYPGHYLITAGPTADTSNPPVASYNFRLFTWTGEPGASPIEQTTEFPFGFSPEGAILPSGPITGSTVAQFVSDDGTGCWRSWTAYAAPVSGVDSPAASPTLAIVAGGGKMVFSWPVSATGFHLQSCTDLLHPDWVDDATPVAVVGTDNVVVEPASGIRFYRLIRP